MTTNWDGVVKYAESHPTRDGGSWSGWCQSFCWRSGQFQQESTRNSAQEVCQATRARGHLILAKDIADSEVPVGWLAMWDYEPDGHIFWVAPNGRYLGASSAVTAPLGRSMGYVSMASYNNGSHGRPTGFSPYMINEKLQGTPTTPGGGTGNGGDGGGTTGGTVVLTADDKAWINTTVNNAITNKIDDYVAAVWAHQMNSAVDGTSHLVQTYMAWAQRDAAAVKGTIDNATPARILAKEHSTPDIWALNPQQGTKRHVTPGQWTVFQACGIKYSEVADGTLTAFTTVTG